MEAKFKSQTFTVSDLYNWHRSKELHLQPKFQRRKVWSPAARSYLIDTVFRGLPMPKILYRMQIDAETVKSVREVVDGQQRLDAIFSFIENQFRVMPSHNRVIGGKFFDQLEQEHQSEILSYDIAADLLIGADDPEVLQIFARINSYTVILNAQEKRNAKYFGVFKTVAYDLGAKHLEFWRSNRILTEQNIARMAEAELASELMIALLDGLQDKKSSVESFYQEFEERFSEERSVRSKFERVITWLQENAGAAIKGTAFKRRPLFYSLFTATADAILGIPEGMGPVEGFSKGRVPEDQREHLAASLARISTGIRKDEPPADLVRFATASSRRTDNIGSRRVRHELLFKELASLR